MNFPRVKFGRYIFSHRELRIRIINFARYDILISTDLLCKRTTIIRPLRTFYCMPPSLKSASCCHIDVASYSGFVRIILSLARNFTIHLSKMHWLEASTCNSAASKAQVAACLGRIFHSAAVSCRQLLKSLSSTRYSLSTAHARKDQRRIQDSSQSIAPHLLGIFLI